MSSTMLPAAVRSKKNKETSSTQLQQQPGSPASADSRILVASKSHRNRHHHHHHHGYSSVSQGKEYERFFTDMELEFGPGIVDRLKSKFASASSASHSFAGQGVRNNPKDYLYVHAKASESSAAPAIVASRKLDGILQQKILMNDNVIIIDRGGLMNGVYPPSPSSTSASNSNSYCHEAGPAGSSVKLNHTNNYNSLAADLVNKSECIEGLVSQYKAIFDAKEPVAAQRRKRALAKEKEQLLSLTPNSALIIKPPGGFTSSAPASMTVAPANLSAVVSAPVPPPRPKKAQLSTNQNGKSPRNPPAPRAAIPNPLLQLDNVSAPKIPARDFKDLKRNYFHQDEELPPVKVDVLSRPPEGPAMSGPPPRPPRPILAPLSSDPPPRSENFLKISSIEKNAEEKSQQIAPLKTDSPRGALSFDYSIDQTGSRLGSASSLDLEMSPPLRDTASGKFEKNSTALGGSRLGVEALMGEDKPPRPAGRFSLDAQTGSFLKASKIGVETPIAADKIKEKLETIVPERQVVETIDRPLGVTSTRNLDHQEKLIPDEVGAEFENAKKPEKLKLEDPIEKGSSKKSGSLDPQGKLILGEFKVDSKNSAKSEKSKLEDSNEKISSNKKASSLDSQGNGSSEGSSSLSRIPSLDSEKENSPTPRRVVLKKSAGYGMTTIIDTKFKPIEPASPALKIDDPALLTSLKDLGRAQPTHLFGGSGVAGGVDAAAALAAEMLKMIVVGHNSPTGSRSNLKSAGNSRSHLRITFNDSATKTHEYPSERSLLGNLDMTLTTVGSFLTFDVEIDESETDGASSTDDVIPAREGDLLRKPSPLSRSNIPSIGLSSYKPSALGQFQLGVERPTFPSEEATTKPPAQATAQLSSSQSSAPAERAAGETGGRPLLPLHQRQQAGKNTAAPSQHDTDRPDQWCVQSSADEGNFSNTASDADDLLF